MFDGCSSLPFIAIPNNVTSIGVSAFDSCSSLQSVAIPNSVTNIDDAAFYNCRSMANIYYAGTLNEWSTVTVDINNAALDIATLHYDSYISVNSASCSADVGQIVSKVDFDYVMKGARLYLAVYDDAGKRLLEAKMTDITPGDTTATITIPTNKSYVGYSYKIMLWDPTSLAPYITYFDGSIPPRN